MRRRALVALADAQVAISAGLFAASAYYLALRAELPHTSLGRTFGDPWDYLIVVATICSSAAVCADWRQRHPLARAMGLIGICTIVLLFDLTYIHLRGFTIAAYTILSNLGIVASFGAHAWLLVTTGTTRLPR